MTLQHRIAAHTLEIIDRLADLQGIAGGSRQHLIHIGEDSGSGRAGAIGDLDDAFSQGLTVGIAGHKGTITNLDVHH